MGFPARLVGVFTSPSSVFEELKERPKWLVALLVVALCIGALNAGLLFSDKGEAILRGQIEEAAAGLTPEQMDQQVAISRYIAPVAAVIAIPIFTLILAGLLYLIFNTVMGGEGTFKQTLSVQAHSGLIGILGGLVQTSIHYIKGEQVSSPTSLSAFLPFLEDTSFIYKLLQGFDLFLLWQLFVLAIGMGIVHKAGLKKSATVIFSIFVVIVVAIAGIRQAFF